MPMSVLRRIAVPLLVPSLVAVALVSPAASRLLDVHRSFIDSKAKLALDYPSAWRVTTHPLTPVTDPVQRFVLYTPSRRALALAPQPDQVIAELSEAVPPLASSAAIKAFPARPRHFRLPALGRMEGFDGNRWAEVAFRDHGRGFYLFVGVGVHASTHVPTLLNALDSLAVGAR